MQNRLGLNSFNERFFAFEGRSLDDVSEWISNRHAGVRYTTSGSPNGETVARLSRAAMDDISLVSYNWNVDISAEYLDDHPAIFLSVPISGQIRMEADDVGKVVPGPHDLRIYRRIAGHRNHKSSNFKSISLIVPSGLMEQRVRSTYQDELSQELSFDPLLRMDSPAGQAIVNLVSYLATQLGSQPQAFESPLVRSSMKEMLVSTVLAFWPHNYSQLPVDKDQSYVPVWVKRAEDYIRANCQDPVRIRDLARHAGCSERTLQHAFKEYRQDTPMNALCQVRLERAHESIMHNEGSITDIALRWGFGSLGRFAQKYVERYGHRPSESPRFVRGSIGTGN